MIARTSAAAGSLVRKQLAQIANCCLHRHLTDASVSDAPAQVSLCLQLRLQSQTCRCSSDMASMESLPAVDFGMLSNERKTVRHLS